MRNKFIHMFTLYFFLFMSLFHFSYAHAESVIDSAILNIDEHIERSKALLQKGLTLYEMDQEIARLSDKERQLAIEIQTIEGDISLQQEHVELTKQRAAKVLKGYYMGEQNSLLLILLSLENLSELLAAYEFVSIVIKSDQQKLKDYQTALTELDNLREKLSNAHTGLQELKQQFIAERTKMLALQSELEAELEQTADAEEIIDEIAQLTREWQDKGLPALRIYLKALAEAINELPDIQSMFNNVIGLRGTSIQFQITDEQLNEFLMSKNPIFENMSFQFLEDNIEASGQHEDMQLAIKGHFSLELEPDNVMLFHIDELLYNDFTLPESTNRSLEEQFSLAFYPDKISIFGLKLKATELHTEPGKLKVILNFK